MDARDRAWMTRALELAQRGRGGTSPNPMVGAVLVKDEAVVGEGWHRRAGEPHAEPLALAAAGPAAHGATLYVTLEPCCHSGGGKRTPPCTEAVIAAGVARVVVAALDPNPRVAGRGVERLRAAGIAVETGVLAEPAEALNVVFAHWMTKGMATARPFVRVKLAQSVDGRIARAVGTRHWVTSAPARARVHALRAESDAVMVGSGTVRVDDPLLTVRDVAGDWLAPWRVNVDSQLRVGPEAAMYAATAGGAWVLTAVPEDDPRAEALRACGVRLSHVPGPDGRVDLAAGLAALAGASPRPVTSVLVEGGGTLVASLADLGLIDELVLHLAPVAYGAAGVPALGPLARDLALELVRVEPLGPDLELVYRPSARPA